MMGRPIETEEDIQRSLEESSTTGLWQAKQNETYTDGPCHSPTCPSLRHVSIDVDRCWVLESGVWRTNPGRWLQGDSPRGWEWWILQPEIFVEETRITEGTKHDCCVMCKGQGFHSVSLPMCSSLPLWALGRDSPEWLSSCPRPPSPRHSCSLLGIDPSHPWLLVPLHALSLP